MPKLHFTKKALESLPIPPSGRIYFHDSEVRGLCLALAATGRKTFVLYRRIFGRPVRIVVGPFPELSIEEARAKAAEINVRVAHGENPAEGRTVRGQMTLEELFDQYLDRHAKLRKKSWRTDVGLFRRRLHEWRHRRISDIRRMDVVELHSRIGSEHPYEANRAIALLRTVFNKARLEWEWRGPNPAEGIRKFPEVSRRRFLQPDELPAFFKALEEEPNQEIADYVRLSLLTGARRSNVLAMRWEDVELKRRIWSIPQTKSGEPQDVVVSTEALEILWRRQREATTPWVFPGTGKSGHLTGVTKGWARILQRAGITNLRPHDLRRTLGSWQAAAGSSLLVIGRSLGHTRTETTAIYARLNLDPVRESVERATHALMEGARLLPESGEGSGDDAEKPEKLDAEGR